MLRSYKIAPIAVHSTLSLSPLHIFYFEHILNNCKNTQQTSWVFCDYLCYPTTKFKNTKILNLEKSAEIIKSTSIFSPTYSAWLFVVSLSFSSFLLLFGLQYFQFPSPSVSTATCWAHSDTERACPDPPHPPDTHDATPYRMS